MSQARPAHQPGRSRAAADQSRLVGRRQLLGAHALAASVVLVVLAAGLAACTSSKSGGSRAGTGGGAVSSTPRSGGELSIGLDAETDGWNPTASQWSAAGYYVGGAIFDPLIAAGLDGKAHPYLAQSVTPDVTSMHWTIKLRPNIVFHDGEPLNADAVVLQLTKDKQSLLVGQLLGPMVKATKVDDLTLQVDMNEPWVAFPEALASQGGYIAAPKQLNASAEQASSHPIGTGPYVFQEWQRDDHLTATRNPAYWRQGLPHPDRVVFRVIPDTQTRLAALQSGQIDLLYGAPASQILQYRRDHSLSLIEQHLDQPGFIMLNTAVAPLDDVRVRRALALATDANQLLQTLGQGIGALSTEPYQPDSPWFSPSGYPTKPDLVQARALIDQYRAAKGISGRLTLSLGCTQVGTNTQLVDLLKNQWKAVGIDVAPKFTEQATFINDAITGHYQANCWTQFGLPDPDLDATWWLSGNAHAVGQVSLNFARLKDPQIDAALQQGRTQSDPAVRKAAYAQVWKRFADQVPYVWTSDAVNGILYSHKLQGITDVLLPDGAKGQPPDRKGGVAVFSLWLSG